MTIQSFLNWGGLGHSGENPHPLIERWHTGRWEDKYHGHGHSHHKGGGKGGGSSAVLSALALLSFLFLINVMQQSLNDNNSTAATAPATALLIREGENRMLSNTRENEMMRKSEETGSFDASNIPESSLETSHRITSQNGNT